MSEYADEELSEAADALADAEKMHNAGVTEKAIVTRLYYACFHAANAVLYSRGFDPQTHQATVRLFGRELVTTGDAPSDDGRFLNDMRSYRQTADYTHDPIEVDVEDLIERTDGFVTRMEELV